MTWLLTAAERSGDLLGGPVISAVAGRDPEARFEGIAGVEMRAYPNFHPLGDVESLGGAGLIELIPRLPALFRAREALRRSLAARPEIAVFIDAPDLHLPLAAQSRAMGIPTAVLVCPQFWAWRRGRLAKLRHQADLILCLFPFEADLLHRHGVPARAVGHPARDRVRPPRSPRSRPFLAVLPGSRPGTRRVLLGPALDAACAAAAEFGAEVHLSWAGPPPPLPPGVVADPRPGWELLADADAAIVAAGTATLEAGLLGLPQVVLAALHPATWALARRFAPVPRVALPNILLGPGHCAEHVQELDRPKILRDLRVAFRPESSDRANETAQALRTLLPAGFAENSARAILALRAGSC